MLFFTALSNREQNGHRKAIHTLLGNFAVSCYYQSTIHTVHPLILSLGQASNRRIQRR